MRLLSLLNKEILKSITGQDITRYYNAFSKLQGDNQVLFYWSE